MTLQIRQTRTPIVNTHDMIMLLLLVVEVKGRIAIIYPWVQGKIQNTDFLSITGRPLVWRWVLVPTISNNEIIISTLLVHHFPKDCP